MQRDDSEAVIDVMKCRRKKRKRKSEEEVDMDEIKGGIMVAGGSVQERRGCILLRCRTR